MTNTEERIAEILEENFDAEDIDASTTFSELDMDSLDMLEVLSQIEDEFEVEIDEPENLNSVADLAAKVDELVG